MKLKYTLNRKASDQLHNACAKFKEINKTWEDKVSG